MKIKFTGVELNALRTLISTDLKGQKPRQLSSIKDSMVRQDLAKKIKEYIVDDGEGQKFVDGEVIIEKAEKRMILEFINQGYLPMRMEEGVLAIKSKLEK